jgi:hypothetical protein
LKAYAHCARCWQLIETLWQLNEGGAVQWDLACGEVYEGEDPAVLALAFLTRAEAQGYAGEQRDKERGPR